MKRRDKTPAPAPSAPVLTLISGGRANATTPLAIFDTFLGASVSATHATLSIWARYFDACAEQARFIRDSMFAASQAFKGGAS